MEILYDSPDLNGFDATAAFPIVKTIKKIPRVLVDECGHGPAPLSTVHS